MTEPIVYAKFEVNRKTGEEAFQFNDQKIDCKLIDFWRWSVSDLVSNATRGILAEYIVAQALGLNDGVRNEWDPYDLKMKSGLKIEVKSSSYLQTWDHKKPSAIRFNIRKTIRIDAVPSIESNEPKRQCDVYVFCVLKHLDKSSIDPLNLDQWDFYILQASVLNDSEPYKSQKSITLSRLLQLPHRKAKFNEISSCVEAIAMECKLNPEGEVRSASKKEDIGN